MKSLALTGATLLALSHGSQTGFLEKFSDSKTALQDSGFRISYPEERHLGGIKDIAVDATRGKIKAQARTGPHTGRNGAIAESEFQSLIEMLRQLDESAFADTLPEGCLEPIKLSLHVARNTRVFVACRGSNPNATILSKMVRKLEFLLLQNTGISE